MGNAVIARILFQPPSPPNALDYLGPGTSPNSDNDAATADANALAKKRTHNISVKYLWLYSPNNSSNGETNANNNLIPAIHITHNNEINGQQQQQQQPPSPQSHKYTLLYSHGNAEDLGLIASFLADLARLLQINVLCYDYSGYGVSTDEGCVAEFYKGFGRELHDWMEWRRQRASSGINDGVNDGQAAVAEGWGEVTASNGHKCRYSKELFVAPIINPPANAAAAAEDDNGEKQNDNNLANTASNGRTSDQEEEEGSVMYDLAQNTCTWASNTLEMHYNYNASANNNNNNNNNYDPSSNADANATASSTVNSVTSSDTPTKQRQRFLSHHCSWSAPSPSETNCYANIQSAYAYLTSVERVLPQHVILYGKSVGSGPTCWLARQLCIRTADNNGSGRDDNNEGRRTSSSVVVGSLELNKMDLDEMCNGGDVVESRDPSPTTRIATNNGNVANNNNISGKSAQAPGGVVLHSPFLSVIRVVLDVGFTTIGDLFPNVDRVGDFTCPAYVIHGSNDAIVPFYHGQTLFEALPDSSKTVPFWARGAGHNNIEMDMPTAYIKRLQQFIRQCDRLNYPSQLSNRKIQMQQLQLQQMQMQQQQQKQQQQQQLLKASLQASLRQSMHHQHQQHQTQHRGIRGAAPRPGIDRYASQDSYHLIQNALMMPQGNTSNKPSKQRKQRGTLVMRSNHGQMQPPPPPSPPAPATSPSAPSSPTLKSRVASMRSNKKSWADTPSSSQLPLSVQQHQYATSNSNHAVRYHRSMSAGPVTSPSSSPSSPHHSQFSHSTKHLQQQLYQQQQHQQQQQHHQQQHNNGHQQQIYHQSPQQQREGMTGEVNSSGGIAAQRYIQ